MPSPFPGMNPYLESKVLWPEVHHWLITLLAGTLVAELRPKYRVAIEHRIYEMEVREGYLEVREVSTGLVVTTIELISPKNKQAGPGRTAYEEKRLKILGSCANLVEIDLLRAGRPMATLGLEPVPNAYQILVSRANQRPRADLYRFGLQEDIPRFLLPLRSEDAEPVVDLQALLHRVYDEAGLDLAVDYEQEPPPPKLSRSDLDWSQSVLENLSS